LIYLLSCVRSIHQRCWPICQMAHVAHAARVSRLTCCEDTLPREAIAREHGMSEYSGKVDDTNIEESRQVDHIRRDEHVDESHVMTTSVVCRVRTCSTRCQRNTDGQSICIRCRWTTTGQWAGRARLDFYRPCVCVSTRH
jgi:hypothetical protein